jgi:ABC-2 type transport system ATP-binding protein
MNAIEVENITKEFVLRFGLKKVMALEQLNLSVKKGEVFGYIGPNGAGKTTTLKILMGLIMPTRGNATIFGEPISSIKVKEKIGFLPEGPYFYSYLTAGEFLLFYGKLFGFDKLYLSKKIDELLDLVELKPKKNTPLRYFSKGMLQRIGLAQALINDPDLVVLDEPMSGLDPLGRARVRDIILQLRDRGKTILFSSHILSDVETICSRIGIISKGKLRETGTIDSLLKNNIKEIEIVAVDLNSEEIQNIKKIGAKVVNLNDTIMITAPDQIKRDAILGIVSAKSGRLQSVENRRETLEDLFMKKYGTSSS